jgi:putative tryptophan/tyrosine transport system substrate-binding protein
MREDSTRRLSAIGFMLTLALLGAPLTHARPSKQVSRIGFLSPGASLLTPHVEAFQQSLRDLGYVEGQNLALAYRYAENHLERLPDLAAELARLPVDVIVTSGTVATRAAKHATTTVPIVMVGIGVDPVEAGLVASLARPEANVTGVAAIGTAGWERRLELLKEVVPRFVRLAVLWKPANPGNALCLSAVQASAMALGVQLHALEVRDTNAFEPAFAAMAKETPDALLICWDGVTLDHASAIANFAVQSRLPTLAALREYAQAGALMSYGTSIPGQWRRAAYYVDKILKGTQPTDLPVELPMQFELVINLKTAQALGLTVPPIVLFQADEVIR